MDGGKLPPKTGNTAGAATAGGKGGGRWPSIADKTVWWPAGGVLLIGLARFCAAVLTTAAGREIEASLNKCSVNVLLWGCSGPMGTLGIKGRLGTM